MKNEEIILLNIFDISPNESQPRKYFDSEPLEKLAESIEKYGILQPILVRRVSDSFEIIAGERRWRAAKLLGLRFVPVIIKDMDNLELAQVALVENIQRENLNSIEEAKAFKSLIEEHNLTQEEIAHIIGKSRSHIANTVRLLNLEESVKDLIIENKLTSGHGRTILGLNNLKKQNEVAEIIIKNSLSVRETENLVRKYNNNLKIKLRDEQSPHIKSLEDKLRENLGTKVSIVNGKNKGKIEIEYYNEEELERIIELIDR